MQQVATLQTQVKGLEDQLKEKNEKFDKLEKRIDDIEQYSRIDDLIISGLKTKHRSFASVAAANDVDDPSLIETDSLEKQVVDFFKSKNMPMESHYIGACHTLPRKDSPTPAIIVRFVNRKHKTGLLKQGFKLKGTDVYVNEHLTKKNADIAKEARTLRKEKKIKATWTRNCKVLIKLNGATPEDEEVKVIKEIGALEQYNK
ncbi:hypothetical protein AAFF_G00174360 [Aldrovandia affinis]|uniref:Uncharacterized protein n=1 Tax=Aldrovandia affinis TaxID=143900 RepID=A0AAD7W839_9TELE|nr:hypothetical protein AAFF_G00174360 [Aldrovandia affinis]